MSDELIESTIGKVLERVDLVAAKLGIAAKEVWRFTVTAKLVGARRDLWKSALLALVSLPFWGWSLHVARMSIPHDIEQVASEYMAIDHVPCYKVDAKGLECEVPGDCQNYVSKEGPEKTVDKGTSNIGWAFVISGIILFFVGLLVLICAVSGLIDALADAKTAEYDAYQDLISDWRD